MRTICARVWKECGTGGFGNSFKSEGSERGEQESVLAASKRQKGKKTTRRFLGEAYDIQSGKDRGVGHTVLYSSSS